MAVRTAVLGASGYSGAELLRLLARHPSLDAVALGAGERSGRAVAGELPHLAALDLPDFVPVEDALAVDADVLFSCLPGGTLSALGPLAHDLVIDLSDDFRAAPAWTYGLTEFARSYVAGARRIANPGCYPTATLLAVAPFLRAGSIGGPVIVDALSGTSGAGRSAAAHLLLAEAAGDVTAYGGVDHRHVPEMERGLERYGGTPASVSFTPHLVPMARGLLVTARASLAGELSDADALDVLRDAYADEPFVHVTDDWPGAKAVAGSNHALVSARVDVRNGFLIASCALDNLGKGAAGQALQNANVALGLPETDGLEALGVWP